VGSYGGAGGGGGGGYASNASYAGYAAGGAGGGGLGGAGQGGDSYLGRSNGTDGGTSGAGTNAYFTSDGHGRAGGGGGGGKITLNSVSGQLEKMYFGSGGGAGGNGEYNAVYSGTIGGNGGGIVYIAADTISVGGRSGIQANGSAGVACTSNCYNGTGGGGAGGVVKLLGETITVGSDGVTATGGLGGSSAGGYTGGYGGAGAVAFFYASGISGTSNPVFSSYEISNNKYSVFVSNEIPTPNSSGYNSISWEKDLNKYGNIQIETRSGLSSNSTDETWEEWYPLEDDVNTTSLQDMDTHTDWVGTNATVAEGDVSRDADYYEDEDEDVVGNVTKVTSSTVGGYVEATISSVDLSEYDYISFWIRSSVTGNTVEFGYGEDSATEKVEQLYIESTTDWQKVYLDISNEPYHLKDAVTKIRFTNLTSSSNTIYLDNVTAERYYTNSYGSAILSTPNNFIQYRVIFTSSQDSYRPILYSVQIGWNSGYKVDLYDSNTARLYNYSGKEQELRLTLTVSGGSGVSDSDWVETGGNIYRGSGNVGIGDTSPDTALKVVGALCVSDDASNCAGNTPGTIYAVNQSVQAADLAEEYKVSDLSIEEGDLVSVKPDYLGEVVKADIKSRDALMGVVSTNPGILMGDTKYDNSRPIGLVGRIPVKVMTIGIGISKGDPITSSPISGIGGIAESPGYIVARALEDTVNWTNSSCMHVESLEEIVWPLDTGDNKLNPCFSINLLALNKKTREEISDMYSASENEILYIGKIMAYVNRVWYEPTWYSEGLTNLIADYERGSITDSIFEKDGDKLITTSDVFAHSFNSNYGYFSILSGGTLNIGEKNFTVDSSGNLGVAGDILIGGRLRSEGDFVISLLEEDGQFEIQNALGDVIFSVNPDGEINGKGVFRSDWIRVPKMDFVIISHGFGKTPSNLSIIKSDNSDGADFSSKGLGRDFYYEESDKNSVKVYNNLSHDIYVKLTIER